MAFPPWPHSRPEAETPAASAARRIRPSASPFRLARPEVATESLVLAVSAWFIVVCNGPFWHALLAGRPLGIATAGFAFAVGVACTALTFILVASLVPRALLKPLLIVLLVITAAATHFMDAYGVVLDPTMVRNVLRTDYREAHEYLGTGLALAELRLVALPLAAVAWVRLRSRPIGRATLLRIACLAGAWLVAIVALLSIYRDFASAVRNNGELRYMIAPGNYVISLARALGQDARSGAQRRIPIGEDARLGPTWATRTRPVLFVLVVGETVRADHLSLDGYARETTPELERLGVINFTDVTSCGTATEASLPCMFSRMGREQYDKTRIEREQGLLDVLARTGLAVTWLDNQSGCKGVCNGDGIIFDNMERERSPVLCNSEGCYDEILLHGLAADLHADGRSQIIVLHGLGNHGPAYYARYPAEYRRFTPTCNTGELRRCTRDEVVNSYDNAIAYTDHVIAQAVDFLRSQSERFDTALLYVSDHGESLGEHGLYLHGMPYAIAPREQVHVPMLLWMSAEFAADRRLDTGCMQAVAQRPASHDNVFHSVLGLLDVSTSVYRDTLDLTATCRRSSMVAAAG